MEKLDKKKILAVVLIIALIAAVAGAVTLFYNAIDMFIHTTFYPGETTIGDNVFVAADVFDEGQKPLAIITLFAALVAFLGVVAGIFSFIVKNPKLKKVSLIVCIVAVVAFLVFIIAARCVWAGFYEEYAGGYSTNYPHYLVGNGKIPGMYAIYSGVMAVLIPELVYFVLIAAALLIVSIMDKKAEKAATETVEEQQ